MPTPANPVPTVPWLTNILQSSGGIGPDVAVHTISGPADRLKGGIGGGPVIP